MARMDATVPVIPSVQGMALVAVASATAAEQNVTTVPVHSVPGFAMPLLPVSSAYPTDSSPQQTQNQESVDPNKPPRKRGRCALSRKLQSEQFSFTRVCFCSGRPKGSKDKTKRKPGSGIHQGHKNRRPRKQGQVGTVLAGHTSTLALAGPMAHATGVTLGHASLQSNHHPQSPQHHAQHAHQHAHQIHLPLQQLHAQQAQHQQLNAQVHHSLQHATSHQLSTALSSQLGVVHHQVHIQQGNFLSQHAHQAHQHLTPHSPHQHVHAAQHTPQVVQPTSVSPQSGS